MTKSAILLLVLTTPTSLIAQSNPTSITVKVVKPVVVGDSFTFSCPTASYTVPIEDSVSTGFVEYHIPLTGAEALRWRMVTGEFNTAVDRMDAAEKQIIAAHHLTAVTECAEQLGIRTTENFIFDSIPDNPRWVNWGQGKGINCGARLAAKRQAATHRADRSPAPHTKETK